MVNNVTYDNILKGNEECSVVRRGIDINTVIKFGMNNIMCFRNFPKTTNVLLE